DLRRAEPTAAQGAHVVDAVLGSSDRRCTDVRTQPTGRLQAVPLPSQDEDGCVLSRPASCRGGFKRAGKSEPEVLLPDGERQTQVCDCRRSAIVPKVVRAGRRHRASAYVPRHVRSGAARARGLARNRLDAARTRFPQGHREALQAVGEDAAGQARSGRPKGLARVACSARPPVGSRQTLTETVNFASLAHGIRGLKITVSAVRFCRWWPPAKSGTYIERLVRKGTKVAALKFWDRTRWLIRNPQVVSSSLTAGSKISKESAPFFDPAAGRGHRWQRIGSRQTLETRSSIRDGFVVSCTGKASFLVGPHRVAPEEDSAPIQENGAPHSLRRFRDDQSLGFDPGLVRIGEEKLVAV